MPGESWEDPQCVEAIKIARENIGDLKLKSDGDYVVPKHLRMNAQQKRAQLIGLETQVHADSLTHTQQCLANIQTLNKQKTRQFHRFNATASHFRLLLMLLIFR